MWTPHPERVDWVDCQFADESGQKRLLLPESRRRSNRGWNSPDLVGLVFGSVLSPVHPNGDPFEQSGTDA